MPLASSRLRRSDHNYWPGFIDVLTSIILVLVFLLSIFVVAQFFLTLEVRNKDTVLTKLETEVRELTELLSLEHQTKEKLSQKLNLLQATILHTEEEQEELRSMLAQKKEEEKHYTAKVKALEDSLIFHKTLSESSQDKVDRLRQNIEALRRQLIALSEILEDSEKRESESQAKIVDLNNRLNLALTTKIQKLERYRSDFLGRLRDILSPHSSVQIIGDRFVFQSEVLFDTSSAELNEAGKAEVDKLASLILELEHQIPSDIEWILRIDGHTDSRPIMSSSFPSNWELSSARAISVVRYLITKGISPKRLVAAGFGQYRPLAKGADEESMRKNRRIELKLTE